MKIDHLKDRLWRLRNLYSIKEAETGRVIPFVPRPEQEAVFQALAEGHRKLIILKARRLGMSTAIDVYAADEAIFHAGRQISIVDRNQDDASKKLSGICKVAFESLPAAIRERFLVVRDNDSSWQLQTLSGDTVSAIYAGKNARGGTNQLLHISEWGVIQADDPGRSEEILTGALPSAEHGVTIIETTWKGGRNGHLWTLVKDALAIPAERRSLQDWRLFFFPWWNDPTYREAGMSRASTRSCAPTLRKRRPRSGGPSTSGKRHGTRGGGQASASSCTGNFPPRLTSASGTDRWSHLRAAH